MKLSIDYLTETIAFRLCDPKIKYGQAKNFIEKIENKLQKMF